jgi:class 3 adenylate cyclase
MESAGEPGRVNISAATWVHVRDLFVCRPRGHLPVKGKGAVEMYFVEGIRPELMTHGQPNERFWHVFASNRAGGPE